MKKLMIAAAGLASMVSTSALAQSFSYNYAAVTGTGTAGSFTIDGTSGAYSLTAFNGTVGGASYTLSSVGAGNISNGKVRIGGLLNGVGNVIGGTNDFFSLSFTPDTVPLTTTFFYGTVGTIGFSNTAVDFIPVVAAGVPEPATWGMMILGFGLVGTALRLRRKVSTTIKFA